MMDHHAREESRDRRDSTMAVHHSEKEEKIVSTVRPRLLNRPVYRHHRLYWNSRDYDDDDDRPSSVHLDDAQSMALDCWLRSLTSTANTREQCESCVS
jgi:hypothetical protein